MENYGNKKTEKYILTRIKMISDLPISADHKIEKLENVSKYVKAFRNGMITEEELLWMIA